jgi:hypothetical protein
MIHYSIFFDSSYLKISDKNPFAKNSRTVTFRVNSPFKMHYEFLNLLHVKDNIYQITLKMIE